MEPYKSNSQVEGTQKLEHKINNTRIDFEYENESFKPNYIEDFPSVSHGQ